MPTQKRNMKTSTPTIDKLLAELWVPCPLLKTHETGMTCPICRGQGGFDHPKKQELLGAFVDKDRAARDENRFVVMREILRVILRKKPRWFPHHLIDKFSSTS